jgi:hypothetical protein
MQHTPPWVADKIWKRSTSRLWRSRVQARDFQILGRLAPTVRRLLPAAAKSAIELDQRQRLALLCGYQVELCRKQVRVRRQYFKIAR